MIRPRRQRRIKFDPHVTFFKPRGVRLDTLEIIELSHEEAECLRLKNIEGFDQKQCAKKMNTSQSTFQRILSSAYEKLSDAVVNGKAIKIIK